MSSQIDAQAIAAVAADYRKRGYQVEIEPAGAALPQFLTGFRPDLIARRADDNVVIEVKVGTRTAIADRFREVAERVNEQPGWRFSVVFADPNQPDQITDGETTALSTLEQRVQSGKQLVDAGQRDAAFLLLWSGLEGLLRVLGERAQLPLKSLPPSALIRELYSAGELSRQQFDTLMRVLPLRDQLVHGFGTRIDVDPSELTAISDSLLGELKEHESAGPAHGEPRGIRRGRTELDSD